MQLSKSDYMMYLKQPAWLWLKKHDKTKLPEPDANLQGMFDEGNLFESIVEQRFVGLRRLGFESYQEYLSLPKRTAEAIAQGERLISQGRFEHEQLTCICDVVAVVGEHQLELIEIKGSTKVKPEHLDDLAFQAVVLEGAGFEVLKCSVVYCNNQYVRHGEIEADKIAIEKDVTEHVLNKREATRREIDKALKVMASSTMPDPSPARARGGGFREWLEIYLSLNQPEGDHHIYQICRPNAQLLAELESRGINAIADIPDDLELHPAQARQVQVTKLGQPVVHQAKIEKFLNGFEYPLYFLDYETLASVIPPFDGLRPYQQLPFQYSLHILEAPGADLQHREYLHEESDNPAPALLAQLSGDIGPRGSVVVWSASFEKGCNELMAQLWPEHAEFLEQLNARVVDLMDPFMRGWYADCNFYGSASIKKVLPVLAPELSYKELGIQEGASAQRRWMQTVLGGASDGKSQLMSELREYCALDTLAMVKIYQYLQSLGKGTGTKEQLSLF